MRSDKPESQIKELEITTRYYNQTNYLWVCEIVNKQEKIIQKLRKGNNKKNVK